MENVTTNYKLKKPLVEDFVNVEELNDNFDEIDKQIKNVEDKTELVSSQLGEKAKIGDDYRPNLLSNSDFQSWSKGSSILVSNAQTSTAVCDSWFIWSDISFSPTISKDVNGIKITAPSSNTWYILFQTVARDNMFNNLILNNTIAYNIKLDGVIYKGTITPVVGNTSVTLLNDTKLTVVVDSTTVKYELSFTDTVSHIINYIKLELNDHTTPFIPLSYFEEQVKSGLAVTKTSGDITYYVSPSGSDTTGDGSQSKPFATATKALNLLPPVINHTVTIWITSGTITEDITCSGFVGMGGINIIGDVSSLANASTHIVNGLIHLKNVTCTLAIRGLKVKTGSQAYGFYVERCSNVYVNTNIFDGTGRNSTSINIGLYTLQSTVYAVDCEFDNFKETSDAGHAIYADYGANIYAINITGSNNKHGLTAAGGGRISLYPNSIPMTSVIPRYTIAGGEITGGTETNVITFTAGTYHGSGNTVRNKVNGNNVDFAYTVISNATTSNTALDYQILKLSNYIPTSQNVYGLCTEFDSGGSPTGIIKPCVIYTNGDITIAGVIKSGYMYRTVFDYLIE
jgi:hypothetical protein